ncbi:MAG: hypothetical protein KAS72_05695 [Phycisphaerales bacterium]|nr:hypothetical protein [Phycisphaerales bacterium]
MADSLKVILDRFEMLLRYIAPGLAAMFILVLLESSAPHSLNQVKLWKLAASSPWLALLAASLVGVTIYVFHTLLVHRILIWPCVVRRARDTQECEDALLAFLWHAMCSPCAWICDAVVRICRWLAHRSNEGESDTNEEPAISETMWDLDVQRWLRRGCPEGNPRRTLQRELDMWASLIKYLYGVSYSLIFVPVGYVLHVSEMTLWGWLLMIAGVWGLIGAFLSLGIWSFVLVSASVLGFIAVTLAGSPTGIYLLVIAGVLGFIGAVYSDYRIARAEFWVADQYHL